MSDPSSTPPVRIADGSDFRATLLRAAKGDDVPRGARLRAVNAAFAAPAALPAAGALSSTLWARGLFGKLVVGSALVLGGLGLTRWLLVETDSASGPGGSPAVLHVPAPSEPPRERESAVPIVKVSDLPNVSTGPGPSEPKVAPSTPSPSAPTSPTSTPQTLAEEVAALDQIRSALRGGDGADALEKLAAYDRKFPTKQLAQEATVLRIEALEKTGDHAGAQRLARAFLRANPKSSMASRITTLLGEDDAGSKPGE